MSHHLMASGRPFVECDAAVVDPVTFEASRCRRRTLGRRDRFSDGPELDLFDLPKGWAVAPYPDSFDHGATRTNLITGEPIAPIPVLVGLVGDLHTCPVCDARSRRVS